MLSEAQIRFLEAVCIGDARVLRGVRRSIILWALREGYATIHGIGAGKGPTLTDAGRRALAEASKGGDDA